MKPQDYSARIRYRPPAAWYRRLNRSVGVLLTSVGLAPRGAVTLEVRGRRSGKVRRTPVLLTPLRDERYLVSLAGESEWVRNVRAAEGRAVLRRRGTHRVHLVEVPVDERGPVIASYLRRGSGSDREKTATQARRYFGVEPDAGPEELRELAGFYPVFRIARTSR